jgi:hypothetical protein
MRDVNIGVPDPRETEGWWKWNVECRHQDPRTTLKGTPCKYLGGLNNESGTLQQKFELESGIDLIFPIYNVACYKPDDGDSPSKLKECADNDLDGVVQMEFSIKKNGNLEQQLSIDDIKKNRVSSNFVDKFGRETRSDGYWIEMSNLSSGTYEIYCHAKATDQEIEATYNITVK